MKTVAVALGAAKRIPPATKSCLNPGQASSTLGRSMSPSRSPALGELDRLADIRTGKWMAGNRLTQADITATLYYLFMRRARPERVLASLSRVLHSLRVRGPARIRASRPEFDPPMPYATR